MDAPIDARPAARPPEAPGPSRGVALLAFLTILLDGFDTTSIGFVVPTLAREWQLPPSAFTPAFVATSLGAVVGYMLSGRASTRLGRRAVILAAVACFAAGSTATTFVHGLPGLALLRLVTGIGLGAAIPACVSLAIEPVKASRREAVAVMVSAGIALGATLGGLAGGALIARHGWTSVFWLGGVLPALLWPVLWLRLPAEGARQEAASAQAASVRRLLAPELRWQTVLLWTFSFLVFTATYALSFWIPTLLLSFGFGAGQVPLGAAAMGIGGVVSAILLIPLTAWRGARPALVATSAFAAVFLLLLARAALPHAAVLGTLAAAGAGLIASTLGQTAVAVSLYPPATRTAGIGWSAAAGRIGSIFGPGLAGVLMSTGFTPREVLQALCVPVLLGVVAMASLGRSLSRARLRSA